MSISQAVYDAKVSGYESDLRAIFEKYAKGELTKEQYEKRKATLEESHLEFLKRYEKEGATKEERKEISEAISRKKAEEFKARAVELYKQYLRGEISRAKMRRQIKRMNAEHIPRIRKILRQTAPKEEYEDISGIEYRTAFEEITETVTVEEKITRTPYTRSLGWTEDIEEDSTVKMVEFVGPPTREQMGLLPYAPLLPGPYGGPEAGSPWGKIYARLEGFGQAYEGMFRAVERPAGIYARTLKEKSVRAYEKGDILTGLSLDVEANLMRLTKGVVTGLTFAVRPRLITGSVSGFIQLATSKEARSRAVTTFMVDPTGAISETAGSFVGGYVAGEILKGPPTVEKIKTAPYQLRTARSLKYRIHGPKTQKVLTKQTIKIVDSRAGDWAGAQLYTTGGKWPKTKTGVYAWAGDGLVPVLIPKGVPTTPGYELISKDILRKEWSPKLYGITGLSPNIKIQVTPRPTPLNIGLASIGSRLRTPTGADQAQAIAQERLTRLATDNVQTQIQEAKQIQQSRMISITELVSQTSLDQEQNVRLNQLTSLVSDQRMTHDQRQRRRVITRPIEIQIPKITTPSFGKIRQPPVIRRRRKTPEFYPEPRRKKKKVIRKREPSLFGELRLYPIRSPLSLLGVKTRKRRKKK